MTTLRIQSAEGTPLPIVYDSPHSGSTYPADFRHAIDRQVLRRSEDAFIDALYGHVVERGATLLHALFPRCYIDPNRAVDDVDIDLIDGVWPYPVAPSHKTLKRGVGLIWRQVKAHGDIYDGKLTVADVEQRITTCWRPYHVALKRLLDEAYERAGHVYHVNCHSMASFGDATTEDGAVERPDFVVGDRDGTTCEPAFTRLIVDNLRGQGFSVAVNDPYKGMELVRAYANPACGRHSVQIELKRARYMDEGAIMQNGEYAATERALRHLTDAIADYVAARHA